MLHTEDTMSKSDKINSVKWSELFTYDSTTGKLYNRVARNARAVAGKEVGTSSTKGYLRFFVQGNQYYVHRAIWVMCNGPIPEDMQVDHINQNKLDNRLENLRLVTNHQNMCNRKRMSNNTSGVTGVSWSKTSRKWQAHISICGKTKCVGVFRSFVDACEARIVALVSCGQYTSNHGA